MNKKEEVRISAAKVHMNDRIAENPKVYENLIDIHVEGQLIGEFRARKEVEDRLNKEIETLKDLLQISDGFKFITGVELSKFNQGYQLAKEDIKETEERVWREAVEYLRSQYEDGFHGLVSYYISSEVLRVEGKERGYVK